MAAVSPIRVVSIEPLDGDQHRVTWSNGVTSLCTTAQAEAARRRELKFAPRPKDAA